MLPTRPPRDTQAPPVWPILVSWLTCGLPSWYPHNVEVDPGFEMPIIPSPRFETLPTGATAFDKRGQADGWNVSGGLGSTLLHFYVVERKLRPVMLDPSALPYKLKDAWGVCSPDISMWSRHPRELRMLSVRMNRMIGVFLSSRGLRVVPTVRWCTANDWDFCFHGIEHGSAVTVSTHGLWRDHWLRECFSSGLHEMVERISPSHIFFHGPHQHHDIEAISRKTEVVIFETDRSRIRKAA